MIPKEPLRPAEFEHPTVPVSNPAIAGLAVVQQCDEHDDADGVAESRWREKVDGERGEFRR